MIRVLLFCNAGMSTSMLVTKMQKAAKEKNIDAYIEAFPEAQMKNQVANADVVLIGPQIKFLFPKAKAICDEKGVPVEVINSADYGMMNGAKVLDRAIKLSGK